VLKLKKKFRRRKVNSQNVKRDYKSFSYFHFANVLLTLMKYEIRTHITRKFCANLTGNAV
jgi:hypothetical protein